MNGPCPYICKNKTDYGYCKTTGCINLKQEVGHVGHCEVNAQGIIKEDNSYWIWEKLSDDCRCSNCGKIADPRYPYCPWCGAKMEVENG